MPVAVIYIRKSVVKANKPTLSPERHWPPQKTTETADRLH